MNKFSDTPKIGVVGLGYVGLPLAVSFAQQFEVLGFDINSTRVAELQSGVDRTNELPDSGIALLSQLDFTCSAEDLSGCDVFIITAPTPIDEFNRPDLGPVLSASQSVGRALKPGAVVIYESTVYPGATEEECVPVLEEVSGLRFNEDFYVGYSPERINPGDREHRFETIVKVTSGSTPEVADFVDKLYQAVVTAGTFRAESIKVAEAAKVIENTQRDINIALVNELSLIFGRLGIDTQDVLAAARTKWNFLPFEPGLVGGHCIGVDPYYLTHKAQAIGYHPELILAGRRINDHMGPYVAQNLVRAMLAAGLDARDGRVLVLGLTFKENTPDLRNTRVVDIIDELRSFGLNVSVHDPCADATEAQHEYGIKLIDQPQPGEFDAIVLAVAHDEYRRLGTEGIRAFGATDGFVLYDLKSLLPKQDSDLRL